MITVRELEPPLGQDLRLQDPDEKLERRYDFWLARTNDPNAAATMVLAETQSAERPAGNEAVANRRKSDALNPGDVAKALSVSPATVIGWIRSGQLKAADIATGKRPRFVIQRAELDRFLQLRQHTPQRKRGAAIRA